MAGFGRLYSPVPVAAMWESRILMIPISISPLSNSGIQAFGPL